MYDPTYALCHTPVMTYINCYMFRHRGAILRQLLQQMYIANANTRSLHVISYMYFTISRFQSCILKIHTIYQCYVSQHFKIFIILIRWAGIVARMGERIRVHRVLVGKPEGKKPLGRTRRRWEDNIKMDLQEV